MNEPGLRGLLEAVRRGETGVEEAVGRLRDLPFRTLAEATLDNHRELRQGYPEAIFCQGKTPEQVRSILEYLLTERDSNVIATRATPEVYRAVADLEPALRYNPLGRTVTLVRRPPPGAKGPVAVVTAGTADLPVAEEAAETLAALGDPVERVTDVGVAGVHRLAAALDRLRAARVIVVAAGMEGALPSVVAGLVDRPVVAVPTSVGYGASFGGLAALLSMLNSCAGGVGVVNIDNGYGAACLAHLINRL
jgi:hypothetical protein